MSQTSSGPLARLRPACAGLVRCQACGKALADHASLAQHLRDRHRGLNRPEAPDGGQTLSLADFVGARR